MIIRARAVVTMDGPPIENGAVAVDGGKIVAVGRWEDLRADLGSAELVDLGECVLLPGLINAHCHLDYTLMRGSIPRQTSFTAWIAEINARKATLTPDDYLASINAGFAEAQRFGTTTIANLEAFPELLARIAPPPLRTWWFAELIDVRARVSAAMALATVEAARAPSWLGGTGIAPHAPFTASRELYEEAAQLGRSRELRLTTHVAESREEMEMFRDGRGALFEFMKSIGRPMDDCGDTTPLQSLIGAGVLDERWIVAHLNELTADDLDLLASGPKFHIVHCPRSHAYFGHPAFRFGDLNALGLNICVGTDSLASNDDLSLFAELRQLAHTQPSLSPRELLETVTVNAAAALGQRDTLGRIRRGFAADLIAVPWHGRASSVLEDVISYREKIPWLMAAGAVLPGV
jgi:aminodeoxyfutalosine deaminase